jgi:TonB family protein
MRSISARHHRDERTFVRKFGKAISISFLTHLTIFILIVGGVFFLRSDSGGSGGSGGAVVTVWLAGPGGQTISGQNPPELKRRTKNIGQKNELMKSREIKNGLKASKDDGKTQKSSGAAGIGQSAGKGTGIGQSAGKAVGSGRGEGIGQGSGGNAKLTLIWKKINRAKYYPMAAKRLGIEGTPRVTFSIKKNGEIDWVKLESSCGEATLDRAALAAVKRAAPLPYFAGPITLQIRYSLSD